MKKLVVFFSLLLAGGLYTASAQLMPKLPYSLVEDEATRMELAVKTIKLPSGIQLEYAEQGNTSGTPVIFLHGLSDSWHSFESVLSFLPEDIHAFAISQRGHGDSDRPATGYTPADFAGDVAEFIRLQGLKTVYVVGHSMGGVIAQQFTIHYPHLVKGLVIIDSDAWFMDNPGLPEFYNEVLKMHGPMDQQFMEEFQRSTLVNPIDPGYYQRLVAEGMKVPFTVFKSALTGLIDTDLRNDLKEIKAPVLIFWGDKDNFCFLADQQTMASAIAGAKLVVYENTGHALHWEKPSRFANDLAQFIQTASTPAK